MGEKIIGAVRHVIGFLVQGINFETDTWRNFERDVKELIAPHMPVLAHRRARLLESDSGERWSDELDSFMRQSLWPMLGDDRAYAERNRTFVTLMLDVTIAAEQRRQTSHAEPLPFVRAFDANWAS
jgi:hypothetical protein